MTRRHRPAILRSLLIASSLIVLTAVAPARAALLGDRIPLPDGFLPEGIATGPGGTFYTGSLVDGTIVRGDARTGELDVLVASPDGRVSVGMKLHRGLLYVAGGPTGSAWVYDAATGETVRTYDFDPGSFVNDVIVTERGAWFTDSMAEVLYRVPVSRDGTPGGQADIETLPLTGDFELQDGFNLNGIEATRNGRRLITVQSNTGMLFRIDPATGDTVAIDLGGETVLAGDGLLLQGRILFVARNSNVVSVVRLDTDLTSGRVVDAITSDDLDVPTTLARMGNRLYVVQARFGLPPTPETQYWIAVVPRH